MADDARLAELRQQLAEAVPEWVGLRDEEPITLADALLPVVSAWAERDALRQAVADELARHTDTMTYNTRDHETVRLGCRCGHERGTVTRRELAADLDGRMRTYRLHVADAVIAVIEGHLPLTPATEEKR